MVQVFFWMAEDPCKQPRQLSHKDMKPCVFHKGHDYFQGSELAYLLGILLLVCFPLVVVFLAYLAIKVGAAIVIKLCRAANDPSVFTITGLLSQFHVYLPCLGECFAKLT